LLRKTGLPEDTEKTSSFDHESHKVKSQNQAIAIAWHEAGATNQDAELSA
jgi:hypothetical protein